MSEYANEAAFIGAFWRAAAEQESDRTRTLAWDASALVGPQMISDPFLRKLYENIRIRFAEGETVEVPIVARDFDAEDFDLICDIQENSLPPSVLLDYARAVVQNANVAEFKDLCTKAVEYLNKTPKDGGKQAAERLAGRLLDIYTTTPGSSSGFPTQDQIVDEGKKRAMQEVSGVVLPWPKLEAECGPWIPGEVIGISAYSNAGKSTFASNLFSGLIDRGVPCIPFPTEMGAQWMDRVVATRARVEQWRAEKQRWAGAEDQRMRFLDAYDALRELEWTLVKRMDISATEIVSAVRILRKKWDGPVVFFVDHMHRLNYGNEEADKEAGKATRLMKNIAGEMGLIGILLYQPRKPSEGTPHGPVRGDQIRGHSSIWNELDVHLSPFRAWVKTNTEHGFAYAGTPHQTVACDYEQGSGTPRFAKPEADGAKLDDEHFFVKVDKRRVGGEGRTVCLNYDKITGRIFEMDTKPRLQHDAA